MFILAVLRHRHKSGTLIGLEILMCQCKRGHSIKDSLVMKTWHNTWAVYMAIELA